MSLAPDTHPSPLVRLGAALLSIANIGLATLIALTPWTDIALSSSGHPPSFPAALAVATLPSIIAGFLGWFAARADSPWHRSQMRSAITWAIVTSAIGFLLGFIAPLFAPARSAFGPFLAFYITGPLGIPVGLALRSLMPFLVSAEIPPYVPTVHPQNAAWLRRCKWALLSTLVAYLVAITLGCLSVKHCTRPTAPLGLMLIPFTAAPTAFLGTLFGWGAAALRDLRSAKPECGRTHNLLASAAALIVLIVVTSSSVGALTLLRDAHRLSLMDATALEQYTRLHPRLDPFRMALIADNPAASAATLTKLSNSPRKDLLAPRIHPLRVLGKSQLASQGVPALTLLLAHPNLPPELRRPLERVRTQTSP